MDDNSLFRTAREAMLTLIDLSSRNIKIPRDVVKDLEALCLLDTQMARALTTTQTHPVYRAWSASIQNGNEGMQKN